MEATVQATSASACRALPPLPAELVPCLGELVAAHKAAQALGGSVWEFAVELDALRAAGLSCTDLRFLVRQGVLVHRLETTARPRGPRTFAATHPLCFAARSAFVLTEEAAAELNARRRNHRGAPPRLQARPGRSSAVQAADTPRWDARLRQLWFGDELLLSLKRPAPLFEQILTALQRRHWHSPIPDPLHEVRSKATRRHLRMVIKRMNKAMKTRLIRFHGNGTGEVVCWHPVDAPESPWDSHASRMSPAHLP